MKFLLKDFFEKKKGLEKVKFKHYWNCIVQVHAHFLHTCTPPACGHVSSPSPPNFATNGHWYQEIALQFDKEMKYILRKNVWDIRALQVKIIVGKFYSSNNDGLSSGSQ